MVVPVLAEQEWYKTAERVALYVLAAVAESAHDR
jgi:hypothetical protein